MKTNQSLQYEMILALHDIKKICDDTAQNISIDSIIFKNIDDIQDLLERIRSSAEKLEY